MASFCSLARHAESARASFPAFSPEGALRRVSDSQKPAVNSAQTVDCLLASVWDHQPAGCHVIPAGLESPKALERSDSAGPLSARLANLQASRQISPSAKHRVLRKVLLRAGLVERASFLQPVYLAKYPNIRLRQIRGRLHQIGRRFLSGNRRRRDGCAGRSGNPSLADNLRTHKRRQFR